MSEFPLIGTPAALDGRPSQPPQRPHLQTQSHSRVQGVRAATQELRKDTTHLKTLYLLDPVIHAFSHTKHIHSHPSSPKVFLFLHILKNCCSSTVLHSRSPPPTWEPNSSLTFHGTTVPPCGHSWVLQHRQNTDCDSFPHSANTEKHPSKQSPSSQSSQSMVLYLFHSQKCTVLEKPLEMRDPVTFG